jgi:hypothetical protein
MPASALVLGKRNASAIRVPLHYWTPTLPEEGTRYFLVRTSLRMYVVQSPWVLPCCPSPASSGQDPHDGIFPLGDSSRF